MNWRQRVEPYVRPLFQLWWRLRRGTTLGVRVIAENDAGQVVLVRHTYISGWHLPGGGVEAGESAALSAMRELEEEAGMRALEPLKLVGIFSNHAVFRGDHVLLYFASALEACACDSDGEIEEVGWFAPDALPSDTSPGTRRRLAEYYHARQVDEQW
ncbi:NUDIX domain-containing protein [Maricaulis sp.]|uniref:NUDIX domain-containing protein n=1 Tax=Maricaulis sp. TaxID=1486257 RepID=UPI002624E667|nr:NUDIX domain-containing protein [Maricaulis sp.]